MPFVFNPFTGNLDYTVASGGGGGGPVTFSKMVPAGSINGVNDTFVLSGPAIGTLFLFKNGLYQREGVSDDYTLSGMTIIYNPTNLPQTGDSHFAVWV